MKNKIKTPEQIKWELYEIEKDRIDEENLPPEERRRRIQIVIKRLKL